MSDISDLKTAFKGDIVTPTDPDYSSAIARWALNAGRQAQIVAFVKDEADVALAIKYARAMKLPLAIRGGGHSPSGSSSSKDGLVIDLSRYINGVRVDAERKVVHVGGGALWEAVDKAAIVHGLATVAGTVNHTGVGGLLLGGGFGWLSPAHGLVIDNLLQATIVTADGSILTASETENPDLFFAIRGGGSNFGVATEFVLQLHPQRRTVYAGMVIFDRSSLEKVVETTSNWFSSAGENEGMLQIATVSPRGDPCIISSIFYNGTEAEGREKYKAFFDIGPIGDTTREIPYEELNALQNPMMYPGQCVYMKGLGQRTPHFPSINKAYEKAIDIWKNSDGFKANVLFEYFPLHKIRSVPHGATAFRRDPTPAVLVLMVWKDDDEVSTERARGYAHEIAGIVSEGQRGVTASENLGYSNYDFEAADIGKADKARLVFADNYPRLQRIKKQYDPESVFNKWFPITPA